MNTTSNLLFDIQKKVLSTTFSHNMAALKLEMPDIYEFYKSYTPKNVQLTFDESSNLNLLANDKLVYQGNPLLESNKQVEKFISDPNHLRYQISRDGEHIFEHEYMMDKIIDKRELDVGKVSEYRLKEGEQIDFIAFMGSGLGYHLESLFSKFAIRSALIFEPDPDCFYATLHTIDIVKLAANCRQHGGKLTFKIGADSAGFVNEISSILTREGYFNIAHMYLYRHYNSDKTTDAFKMVHKLAHRYVTSWGFFEDEITGVSHTLRNIGDHKYPTILKTAKEITRDYPVFIIGNGPSLDESIKFLQENQANGLVISSGTSLKPLLDNGIIPDIHIEMERAAKLFTWVNNTGHKDKLKKINLICLNTVYPKICKLFKRAHILLKPNDAASTFIQNFISEKYTEILYCNPTVTNASSAAMVNMGFKNLFLFGVDYGFKSAEYHHSKGSLHYKKDSMHQKDSQLIAEKAKKAFKVEGNFGGEVFTDRIFDGARMSLGMLLNANPNVTCTNCSDGSSIALTKSCRINDLPVFSKIEGKSILIEELLADSFDSSEYLKKDLMFEFESLLPKFNVYINKLKLITKKVITRTELSAAFSEQYLFVKENQQKNRSKELFERFMQGTLNYMHAHVMSNTYCYINPQEQQAYIQFCINVMNEHFDFLLNDLKQNYNKAAKF